MLPRRGDSWSGGGCDEQIGRICLRFSGDESWVPLPESPELSAERDSLLAALERIGTLIPGDRWVLGQRIRYLGDVGRWGEAEALARECRGGPAWWCPALQGYVLHRGGRVEESEEAFRRALETMPARRAQEWRDPRRLLEYGAARWIGSPGPLSREEAVDRFWRMADPLFLTPGNERLTEHYARHFGSLLYEDAAITMGLGWETGLEQLLIRYGFAAGWDRSRPEIGEAGGGSVVEHHHPEARGLLPPYEALKDPASLPPELWIPVDDAPRSFSTPVLAPLLAEGRGQVAVLRRDGRLRVVAAWAPPTDTVLSRHRGDFGAPPDSTPGGAARAPWEPSVEGASEDTLSGLFLLPASGDAPPFSALGSGGKGFLELEAPPGGYLLSLELWCPAGRWGARLRHGVRGEPVPPDVPTLSDLMVLASGDSTPGDLQEALPRLLPSTTLPRGDPLTVAWEVYGLGTRREPPTFRISLLEEEPGLLRRAIGRLGLFRAGPALVLSWTEGGFEGTGPLFRAVDLDLGALEPGRYLLRVEMELPFRNKVMSTKDLTLY